MLQRRPFVRTIQAYMVGIIFITHGALSAKNEIHETQIFSKWHAWQQKYYDKNLATLAQSLDSAFPQLFKKNYQENLTKLKPLTPFLSLISNNQISPDGFNFRTPMDKEFQENMSFFYAAAESDISNLVLCLVKNNFCYPGIDQAEQTQHFDITIDKYKALGALLFGNEDSLVQKENLFAFANRLFEYCYTDATTNHYQTLMTSADLYPVARFINATMWYQLVGEGWKHWHANTIDALKRSTLQGKTVKYIAGGTDIYQLLREGIYNISVIDPFLPSQERFYSEGWEFLIESDDAVSGIGDEIRFGPDCNSIKMKRSFVITGDSFTMKTSDNSVVSFKKSITTWDVFDRSNKKIGAITFHRRPVEQNDLIQDPASTLLVSYDELIYIALPEILHGWGIDPSLFSDNFTIYTKQLRNPVTKSTMLNIRTVGLINFADLRFINLGSDPQ